MMGDRGISGGRGNGVDRGRVEGLLAVPAQRREEFAGRLEDRIATLEQAADRLRELLAQLRAGDDVLDEVVNALDIKRGHDWRLDSMQLSTQRVEKQTVEIAEAVRRNDEFTKDSLKGVVAALRTLERRIAEGSPAGAAPGSAEKDAADKKDKDMLGGKMREIETSRRSGDEVFGKRHPRFNEAKEKATTWVIAVGRPMKPGQIERFLREEGGIPEFTPPAKSVGNRLIAMGFSRARKLAGGGVLFWPNRAPLPAEFLSV